LLEVSATFFADASELNKKGPNLEALILSLGQCFFVEDFWLK